MAVQCTVDHSAALLSRLLGMVNTDTSDVTFVLLPSSDSATSSCAHAPLDDLVVPHRDGARTQTSTQDPSGKGPGAGADRGAVGERRSESEMDASPQRVSCSRTVAAHARDRDRAARAEARSDHPARQSTVAAEVEHAPPPPAAADVAGECKALHERRMSRSRKESREFRCHRFLFASQSEYFRALLYGGMSESETHRVELRDVTPEAFQAIVTYVYTGRVFLTAGEREMCFDEAGA